MRNFSGPMDALLCAEGAAAEIAHAGRNSTCQLAKEAKELLEQAYNFLVEYYQKKEAIRAAPTVVGVESST